jgi:acetyl-CoA carboxylase biotin carboxylase subunit
MPPYYDSLAAKVMTWAPTRLEALRKLRRCLEEFTLEGFQTNAEFSYEILFHPAFVRGGYATDFLDKNMKELLAFSKKLSEQTEGL